jgi:hypothetical protein
LASVEGWQGHRKPCGRHHCQDQIRASISRENYLAQLVCERMTGKPAESYSNAAMQWGTDTDRLPEPRMRPEMDILVTEVGFIDHPWITMSGASPDGLANDGMVEIKCPIHCHAHSKPLLDQKVPEKYITQMMWQMACTERPWCDFVSLIHVLQKDIPTIH